MKTPVRPDYITHCSLCGWPEGQPWLTAEQAAASLSIRVRKLREMVNMGVFSQVLKVGRTWRIHHEALDAYIAETQEVLGVREEKNLRSSDV